MLLKLKPNRVYRSYYGGKRLDALCGKPDPADTRFPEEWIASTVTAFNAGREHLVEGLSVCTDGRLLRDVIAERPAALLGAEQYRKYGGKMSILVKLLDAAERLFIQCHPTPEFAGRYFGSSFGKTECWYILSADPGACVYLGFRPEITRGKWHDCFERQDTAGMLSLLHRLPVAAGDLVFVTGGMPHAIGGGCLLCELQEPTDYMVIPERRSASGITLADEKMHGGLGFARMLDCFVYEGLDEDALKRRAFRQPQPQENTLVPVVDRSLTDRFRMDVLRLNGKAEIGFNGCYAVAVVTAGSCEMTDGETAAALKPGESLFIGADSGRLRLSGKAEIIFCLP